MASRLLRNTRRPQSHSKLYSWVCPLPENYQFGHSDSPDIAMPVMDGLLSSRKIRDFELEHSFPRTRIVAMTCFSSVETQAEAFSSGMDMFLIKPVPMKALKPVLGMDPDDFPAG